MSKEVNKMLNSEDKGVQDATGVLSRLFRQILLDINVTPLRWNDCMIRYLNNPRNGIAKNSRDRSTARGNLNKALHRSAMTWKTFTEGLRFLGPKSIKFEIHVEWANKKTTSHSVKLEGWESYEEEHADNE